MSKQRSPRLAALWAALVAAALVAGCASAPRETLGALVEVDSLVASATETLAEAIELGALDVTSDAYAAAYAGLVSANRLTDSAWALYRAGETVRAGEQAARALDAYQGVRPLLIRLGEGER